MTRRTTILLKLTGELFGSSNSVVSGQALIRDIAHQIKTLSASHRFGIVVGGGNFFRGSREGAALGLAPTASHQIGMLATVMNGLMLQNIFGQEGVTCHLLSALECPSAATAISPQSIACALESNDCVIFVGGIGTPFFTTDTSAIVRGLQIEAAEVWKATKVDGVYSADPHKNPHAQKLLQISYLQALHDNLGILDATAFTLAQEQRIVVRVFSLFEPQALIKAAQDPHFGSILYPT